MNIATYELTIPAMIQESERRAARAQCRIPASSVRWSPIRWLRAQRTLGPVARAGGAPERPRID